MVSKVLIGVILVVIVAIALLFFVGLPSPSFEQTFSNLNQVWQTKGIQASNLDESTINKIVLLSQTDLDELKTEFESAKAKTVIGTPQYKLADIYFSLVEFVKYAQLVEEKEAELDEMGLSNPCAQLELIKERNDLEEQRINHLAAFEQKINSFVASNPREVAVAGLVAFEADVDFSQGLLAESRAAVAELEAGCS